MRIKSYFANTVEAALPLASKELGDEAMLLYSRESAPETRYLGRYEVVFGVAPDEPAASVRAPASPRAPDPPSWAVVLERLEQLERKVEGRLPGPAMDGGRDRRLAEAPAFDPATLAVDADPSGERAAPRPSWKTELTLRLLAQQLDRSWIERLVDHVGRSAAGPSSLSHEAAWIALRAHMTSLAGGGSPPGPALAPRVVAVTGPAGAGKTTVVIKLAAAHWKRSGRWPDLVALPCPAAAQSEPETQLAAYAQLTGAICRSADSPEDLGTRLRGVAPGSLTLVDAGVLSPTFQLSAGFAGVLRSTPGAETWLALSAAHAADLEMTADAYRWLAPSRLVYTHLDGIRRWGPLWTLSAGRSLPVSYLSAGQRIFDDFAEAGAADLVDRILGPPVTAERSSSAALPAGVAQPTLTAIPALALTAIPALAGQAR